MSDFFCITSNYLNFITGRNEVVAKVIFLHLSVIHSVHRGGVGLPQCMLGYHPWSRPPREQTPPQTRQTPLPEQTPPPRDQADTPLDQADTPQTRQTPPGPGRHPPRTRPPSPREADCSIRLTSGRYASYWNAFLFEDKDTTWRPHKFEPPPPGKHHQQGVTCDFVDSCPDLITAGRFSFKGNVG